MSLSIGFDTVLGAHRFRGYRCQRTRLIGQGAVDPVDMHTDTSAEETALHHRHLDRESGEIMVDQDDDVADLCPVVGVEPAAGCTSVDRHLELLASTVRLEQVDDGRAALPGDVGHGGFGDIESHDGVNRCARGNSSSPLLP